MPSVVPEGSTTQVFTANGTWTKPVGATSVYIRVIGAGGPGGSGRRGAAGSARSGGTGGGSGAYSFALFSAAELPATLNVVVATGGTAGAAVTVNSTNGNDGVGANPSYVSDPGSGIAVLLAAGGANGVGGTAGVVAGGAGADRGMILGSAGGGSNATGAPGNGISGFTGAPGGGGGGGGITAGNVNEPSGQAGLGGVPFGSGVSVAGTYVPGNGATGGNSFGAPDAAAAENYGGGGGGGAASPNGTNSGAGSKGGDSVILITTYF